MRLRIRVEVEVEVEEGGGGGGRRDDGGGRREGREGERGERRIERERGVGMVKGEGAGIGIEEERGDVGRWRIVGEGGERCVWEAKLTSLDCYHYGKLGNGNRSWNLIKSEKEDGAVWPGILVHLSSGEAISQPA